MASSAKPYDCTTKLVLVGDMCVGKSALLKRLAEDCFHAEFQQTIGVDFRLCGVTLDDGRRVKLQMWDTAGQERYRTITSSYYRGAHGILLVFDLTSYTTFAACTGWLKEIHAYAPKTIPIMLLGAKLDLATPATSCYSRQVSKEDAESFAEEHGLPYLEYSAKTQDSILLTNLILKPFVTTVLGSAHYTAKTDLVSPPIRVDSEDSVLAPSPRHATTTSSRHSTTPRPKKPKKKSSCCS